MNTRRFRTLFAACACAAAFATQSIRVLSAADSPSLDPNLEPLRPFLGKTWKGEFKNSTPDKPVVDVMQWERALNGKAVRVLHSINDGEYGGETLITWSESEKRVVYHYFTTAGFTTVGTMTFKEGGYMTHELVKGSSGGVTEVRGTSKLLDTGVLNVKTEYMKEGKWEPGRETAYRQDPNARVVFR